MDAVEHNQPAAIQDPNKAIRDAPKLSRLRSAVLMFDKPISHPWRQSRYFANVMASTQKENSAVVAAGCFFTLSFLRVARFACGVWPSTGKGAVRARIRSISSEGSGGISANFAPLKISCYKVYMCT